MLSSYVLLGYGLKSWLDWKGPGCCCQWKYLGIFLERFGKKFQTPDENLAIGMGESPSFFPF